MKKPTTTISKPRAIRKPLGSTRVVRGQTDRQDSSGAPAQRRQPESLVEFFAQSPLAKVKIDLGRKPDAGVGHTEYGIHNAAPETQPQPSCTRKSQRNV